MKYDPFSIIASMVKVMLFGDDKTQSYLNEQLYKDNKPISIPANIYNKSNPNNHKKSDETVTISKEYFGHLVAGQASLEAIKVAVRQKSPGRRLLYEGEILEISKGAGYE